MNKKYTTYLLLLLVAAIWGYIFYKFFSDLSPSQEIQTGMAFTADTLTAPEDTTEEKFSIMANYRDPFTGNISRPVPSTGTRVIKPKTPVVKAVITWPEITYLGLINNTGARKKIGFLKISVNDYMVSPGDLVSDIKIITITNNQIILSYQKETKSFSKSGK